MNKWLSGLCEWIRLNLLLLLCMVVLRPIFFFEVYYRVGLEPHDFVTVLSGVLFDLLLVGRVCIYGMIPFLLVHYFFPKAARGVMVGLIVAYTVVSAILTEYFCNLTMPLDHVILVYTTEELKTTAFSSSSSLTFGQVLGFLLQVGLPVLLIFLWRKVKIGKWFAVIVAVLALVSAVFVRYPRMIRKESLYPSHYDFCLAVNQPSYSYVKITDFIKESKIRAEAEGKDNEMLASMVEAYHAVHPEFEYDHPGYPFYRKTTDPDVLGPFFNTTSDSLPPNLVFIVVEGMGRHLTGVAKQQISFTPFIDSLASEGLFWPNCLSTSARTFGVLPAVFASPPHGRFGFSTPLAPTPRHHSLLLDLEKNGYSTAFYYGGDMTFDGYDFFMKSNHVDHLYAPQLIVEDSAKYLLLEENHRWGWDDDQLFQFAIAQHNANTADHRPYCDIYLTLTTHEPFLVDDIEKYENRVKQMVEQTPQLPENERNNVLRNLNVFGCWLYTDESIRELFRYYASRPDFNNTIFVITGDHRMVPMLYNGISLWVNNVPLVVYSPLLKRTKVMGAVVSHLDITPSINAYLNANYNYAIPDHCHWLGTSFDTLATFRNVRKLAFMLNNRDVVDYVNGLDIVSSGKLIKLDSVFIGSPGNDEQLRERLLSELETFDMLCRYVVQNDVVMPFETENTILVDTHLDFDKNSLEVFDKYLLKEEGYLHLADNVEYLSLCSNLAIRPLYENIMIEVSFDVRSNDTLADLPVLAVALGDRYWQSYRLESSKGEPLNTGEWEHFHTRFIVNTFDMENTEALKLNLWNTRKSAYDLDNLVVTIEGRKR